ncbi:glycoside hydrolase family 76 protein [Flavobacterium beibuense]|uniref:Glycoside hydrolase family 76 n=1 Tax=Flavobacterium beibuense TaxID=657326 RepID=A0A444WGQ7_9FLAO|nr:glycoside hydrolase family 76 protein [Flavobacterium beibuense]RYJ44952.1 Glycoside hydrolase family 76 [Flavobacterium beibuense]
MKSLFSIQKYAAVFVLGLGALVTSCDDDPIPLNDPSLGGGQEFEYTWAQTADSLQAATYNTFLGSNGTFVQNNAGNSTFHYWPNAHALHVLTDGYLRTGDENYVPKMKALLDGIKVKNGGTYNNVFNDDMIWLANACVRAYNATNDEDYKDVALELWGIIKQSWSDDVFGGGITWKQDTPYQKNAVSNAPAAILAMRLYEIDQNPDDLVWAQKIYDWQKSTLVNPSNGIVWDNISSDGPEGTPVVNSDWVFTYNMGTYIGAGVWLYNATGDQSYLTDAVKSAKTLIISPQLTTEGILKDEGQGDGGLFKGILVRYFTELIEVSSLNSTDRSSFVSFLRFNATTFYNDGLLRPSMMCGPNWKNTPTGTTDLTTQLSGVMLIEAAAKLHEEQLLD